MVKSLVIVESNTKSKTINRFLGPEYIVRASVGHIKNLPKNRIGVDIQNGFEPEYITIRGRGKILQELKKLASGASSVFIATDPDREGEAIAYHLAEEIRPSNENIKRVLFHEITENAIQEAIHKPLSIDLPKVEAQKARRVMDRLVGYQVSPFLWKTLYRGLSAGRVQTVALRLISEREEEILRFVPQEYWTIDARFKTKSGESFISRLVKIAGKDAEIPNQENVEKHTSVIKQLEYAVSDLRKKQIDRNPYPPYTTSTFQQDAARRLGMTTKQVMTVAQQLYEGVDLSEGPVGLITYMRTDSTRLAKTAVDEARQYIVDSYGLEYVPQKARSFKNKKSAQDAHEAIRPTSMKRAPQKISKYLSPAQNKLYELIWNRFIASQMASARMEQTILEILGGEYLFRTTGTIVKFKGFMQLYAVEDKEESPVLPEHLKKGETVGLSNLDPQQHFTKPPARFNESSLVKELDALGIGRPSTYALIISTLLDRKYVDREARSLKPTELGSTVNRILIREFPEIFNVGFTSRMEEELDQIESGDKERLLVLNSFYSSFNHAVSNAMEKKDAIRESLQEEQKEKCPKCGLDLIIKWGRNGKFIACTGYPDCKYTKPVEGEATQTNQKCEKCGSPMVAKTGRFGRFLACSTYPDCKFTKPFSMGIPCPLEGCGGEIIERKSGRGKLFYGCSKYPACKFASWYKPVAKTCTQCGNPFMQERYSKKNGNYLACSKCKSQVFPDNPPETVREESNS